MITVEDLLGAEELGLTLVSGESGLSRRVSWAHSAEITDVSQFLSGGELILSTGLGFPDGRKEQLAYIDSLDAAGAAALALGSRRPEFAPEFLQRADELGLPVLHTAWAIPYSKVVRWVASHNSEDYRRDLELQLQILEVLHWQSNHGAEPRAVVERLERLTGTRISITYEDGGPVIADLPVQEGHHENENGEPAAQESPRRMRRLKLPLTAAREVFLSVEAEDPEFFIPGGAVQQLSSALSVVVAGHFHELEYSRRFQAELFSAFLSSGSIPPRSLKHLHSLGFSENDDQLIIIIVIMPGAALQERLALMLQSDLPPSLVLAQQHELIALTTTSHTDELRRRLERMGLNAGASAPFAESGDLQSHLGQARWAARYGPSESGGGLVGFDEIRRFNPWLGLDPESSGPMIDRILGALLRYDEAHGTELVSTLTAYFQQNRSLKLTARRLTIHPQTLRYRLRRVQEITGRDINSTQNLSELWWAVSMLDAKY